MQRAYGRIRAPAFVVLALALYCLVASAAKASVITIHGRVGDHVTGASLAAATVDVYGNDSPISSTSTLDDGTYTLSVLVDLPPGSAGALVASAYGYVSARVSFDPAASDIQADFALHPMAAVSGTIHAVSGATSNGVVVRALRRDGTDWTVYGQSYAAADGHYELDGLPADTYRLCAGGIHHGLVQQCFDAIEIRNTSDIDTALPIVLADEERRSGIDFTLDAGGSISGKLTDTRTGLGIANGTLIIDLYDVGGNLLDSGWATADESGTYHMSGIPAGTFYLTGTSRARGFDGMQLYSGIDCPSGICPPITAGQALTLAHGASVSQVDFAFSSDAAVHGVVTDAISGQPIGGVKVEACFDGGLGILCWYDTQSRQEDGSYDLYVDGDQYYMIVAQADDTHIDQMYPGIDAPAGQDYRDGHDIHILSGDQVNNIDFSLQPSAWISGTIRDAATGEPLPGAYVLGYNATNDRGGWYSTVDENGNYSSFKTFPGTYYVAAYEGWPQRCAFYLDRPCPASDSDPISSVDPTPIIIVAGERRSGIDIRVPHEVVFTDGFDPSTPSH